METVTPLYVDKLITKRHHGLKHILNAVGSKEGTFWMNSVHINKACINPLLNQELGETELQTK